MVEIKDRQINAGLNELEKTFQEYKKKLEYTEQEAQQIIELAWKKADIIIKENQSKAQQMADATRQAAKIEADKVIAEANAKAAEVETIVKDQLSKAQKMADEIMQAAKENSFALMNETGRLVDEVSQKAGNVLSQFQARLQSESTELIVKIDKAKDSPDRRSLMTKNEATASGDKNNGSGDFRGQRKLIVLPPYTEVQTKKLAELLKQIPGIKIDGTSAVEGNFSIALNIGETIPLKSILSDLSLVESSELKGDIIQLKLKPGKIGSSEH